MFKVYLSDSDKSLLSYNRRYQEGSYKLTEEVKALQKRIASSLTHQNFGKETIYAKVSVGITIDTKNDLDNVAKLLIDALQQAKIINDDKQVHSLKLTKKSGVIGVQYEIAGIDRHDEEIQSLMKTCVNIRPIGLVSVNGLYGRNKLGKIYRTIGRSETKEVEKLRSVILLVPNLFRGDIDNLLKFNIDEVTRDDSWINLIICRRVDSEGKMGLFY